MRLIRAEPRHSAMVQRSRPPPLRRPLLRLCSNSPSARSLIHHVTCAVSPPLLLSPSHARTCVRTMEKEAATHPRNAYTHACSRCILANDKKEGHGEENHKDGNCVVPSFEFWNAEWTW